MGWDLEPTCDVRDQLNHRWALGPTPLPPQRQISACTELSAHARRGLLQKAFPEMQMVLTTHSPHVLSTVEVDSIRVISLVNGQGTVELPVFQTRGVQSANILSQVMDVHAVPPVEKAAWLSEYRALVQMSDEDSSAGRSLWSKLVAHFGEDHSVMAEVAVLRRLQEFRRKSVPRQGGN